MKARSEFADRTLHSIKEHQYNFPSDKFRTSWAYYCFFCFHSYPYHYHFNTTGKQCNWQAAVIKSASITSAESFTWIISQHIYELSSAVSLWRAMVISKQLKENAFELFFNLYMSVHISSFSMMNYHHFKTIKRQRIWQAAVIKYASITPAEPFIWIISQHIYEFTNQRFPHDGVILIHESDTIHNLPPELKSASGRNSWFAKKKPSSMLCSDR